LNYRDPDMSLKKLALKFNLSEVYLSSLFKEMMGVNFYSYLEDLRMKDALELLRSTDYTVDHVAMDVGYNSSHVFRRAFKRRFGVSPSGARI
jgi:AraC-like DNA-binding protein